jgi:hypothetical protein
MGEGLVEETVTVGICAGNAGNSQAPPMARQLVRSSICAAPSSILHPSGTSHLGSA